MHYWPAPLIPQIPSLSRRVQVRLIRNPLRWKEQGGSVEKVRLLKMSPWLCMISFRLSLTPESLDKPEEVGNRGSKG